MIKHRSCITQRELNKLREIVDFDSFEGVLADNYIFYNTEHLKPTVEGKRVDATKYIIVREKSIQGFLGYTLELEAMMTNDINTVEEWEDYFMEN